VSAPLGLSESASELLDDLQGSGVSWVFIDHLCVKRDAGEVHRLIAELVHCGFTTLRRGRRGRQVVELTKVGRHA
jgi:hypothetical protein